MNPRVDWSLLFGMNQASGAMSKPMRGLAPVLATLAAVAAGTVLYLGIRKVIKKVGLANIYFYGLCCALLSRGPLVTSRCCCLSPWSQRSGKVKGKVSALYVYPIKSCGGVQVKSRAIEARGFLCDR